MSSSSCFGFLEYPYPILFNGGAISLVPDYERASAWVSEHTNRDGFLYPPASYSADQSGREIPHSLRPALLHQVPPSHDLALDCPGTSEPLRRGPGAFLIHLLAYLFGTRLQFEEWWVDGRIPIKPAHGIRCTRDVVGDFLSHSLRTWNSWPEKSQRLLTNLLFMHSRTTLYPWEWEQFANAYKVFDGCHRLATDLRMLALPKEPPHKERIRTLCKHFQIPLNADVIEAIVRLRNGLFHETLWDGGQPCSDGNNSSFYAAHHLQRLNQRLIPAMLGYKTPYVQTCWWSIGSFSFDSPSPK